MYLKAVKSSHLTQTIFISLVNSVKYFTIFSFLSTVSISLSNMASKSRAILFLIVIIVQIVSSITDQCITGASLERTVTQLSQTRDTLKKVMENLEFQKDHLARLESSGSGSNGPTFDTFFTSLGINIANFTSAIQNAQIAINEALSGLSSGR